MLEGMLTAVGTLCLVVLIIYLSYAAAKFVGQNSIRGGRSRYMRMIDQMPLGQSRAVSVVQVGDRYFLIGIAEKQIHILAELEEEGLVPLEMEEPMNQAAIPDFKELMRRFEEVRKHWSDKK